MFVVISYDIQNDKRRTKVHKCLKSFGQWVQFSVFECELEKADYLRLRDRLDRLLDKTAGDSVRFYFLCERCSPAVERIGGEAPLPAGAVFV
jgi:CRISPR-associated protein Cas2